MKQWAFGGINTINLEEREKKTAKRAILIIKLHQW